MTGGSEQIWRKARTMLAALAAMLPIQSASAVAVPEGTARVEAPARVAPLAERAEAPTGTALLASVRVTRELDIPHWLRPGEFAWNDEGVAPGETIVVVNIRARVLSVYRGGIEIGRSSLIYGADNKPTPTGSFPILAKHADHVSNLYNAPMPHTLRLTWDGIAVHGSPTLEEALATRGCVGLPVEFAELLFGAVRVGDRVVIWDGTTAA